MAEEMPGRRPRYEPLGRAPCAAEAGDHRVVAARWPARRRTRGLSAGPLRELEAPRRGRRGRRDPAIARSLAGRGRRASGGRPAPTTSRSCVPTRTSLGALMDALRDRGVEFRAETGTLVYETQEIRDLLAVLRAIAHGTDAVALVAALRSPILGVWRRRPGDLRPRRRAMGPGRAPGPIFPPTIRWSAALDFLGRAACGPVVDGTERADRTDRAGPLT